MIAALHQLDDRMLQDIGLSRGEIVDFVDSLDGAELARTPVAPEVAARRTDATPADLRRAA